MKRQISLILSLIIVILTGCSNSFVIEDEYLYKERVFRIGCKDYKVQFPIEGVRMFPEHYEYGAKCGAVVKNGKLILKVSSRDYYNFDLDRMTFKRICKYGSGKGEILGYDNSVTKITAEEVLISDIYKKLNIYDNNSQIKDCKFVPAIKTLASKFVFAKGNLIQASGTSIRNTNSKSAFFEIDKERLDFIANNMVYGFLNQYNIANISDNILVTSPETHEIREFDVSGNLLRTYDTIPEHYVSPSDVGDFERSSGADQVTANKEFMEWIRKWTFTGTPSIYSKNMFIVPRLKKKTLYMDFYRYDEEKKYVGTVTAEERFFIDSNNKRIYLGQWEGPGKLLIEEYSVSNQPSQNIKLPVKTFEIDERILETLTDPFENMVYIAKQDEKYKASENLSEILEIKNLENEVVAVKDLLSEDKDYHFVIYTRNMNDGKCQFLTLYKACQQLMQSNENIDTNIIVSNPEVEFLKSSEKHINFEDAKVLFNSDISRLKSLYSYEDSLEYPWAKLILLDKNGDAIIKFDYKGNMFSALPEFMENCMEIISRASRKE